MSIWRCSSLNAATSVQRTVWTSPLLSAHEGVWLLESMAIAAMAIFTNILEIWGLLCLYTILFFFHSFWSIWTEKNIGIELWPGSRTHDLSLDNCELHDYCGWISELSVLFTVCGVIVGLLRIIFMVSYISDVSGTSHSQRQFPPYWKRWIRLKCTQDCIVLMGNTKVYSVKMLHFDQRFSPQK